MNRSCPNYVPSLMANLVRSAAVLVALIANVAPRPMDAAHLFKSDRHQSQ
jgi:hypothetical protein